jgi:predicted nucleic acid-binding protein
MSVQRALALDTNVLIFAVEGSEADAHVAACRRLVFEAPPPVAFVVSEVVLSEVLVRPMREGNAELVRFYRRMLTDLRAFRLVQVSRSVLLDAAQLRSVSSLKLADAIHLATAERLGCVGLVTLDQSLKAPGARRAMTPEEALTLGRR